MSSDVPPPSRPVWPSIYPDGKSLCNCCLYHQDVQPHSCRATEGERCLYPTSLLIMSDEDKEIYMYPDLPPTHNITFKGGDRVIYYCRDTHVTDKYVTIEAKIVGRDMGNCWIIQLNSLDARRIINQEGLSCMSVRAQYLKLYDRLF